LAGLAAFDHRYYVVVQAGPVDRLTGSSFNSDDPLVGGVKFREDVAAGALGDDDALSEKHQAVVH
jgi:hypothetical protein